MEPDDAVPGEATVTPRRPAASRRHRAVVALVRPCSPNAGVLVAAADLAERHGCALLVLGTLDPLTADWVDGVDLAGPMLETAHAELFADCVELLWHRNLVWGVNVLRGRIAAEARHLDSRVDIVRVVHGARRRPTPWRRLCRLLTGRLERALRDLDLVAA